ncbi:MAG TPA: hypothetical protein GX724_02590 [Fibrobacter sp.]|nr:hypothetical protein [Fibrobacter sp.]
MNRKLEILVLTTLVFGFVSCKSEPPERSFKEQSLIKEQLLIKEKTLIKEQALVVESSSSSIEIQSSSIEALSSSSVLKKVKIEPCSLTVENASGSGSYLEGERVLLFPVDKTDSGLCFREWELNAGDQKYLEMDGNSDTAWLLMPKTPLIVKALFRSCYEGLESIEIGNLKWTAKNINIKTFSNSWCYEGKRENCNRYGRLYDFNKAQKICQSGWRLPTEKDWDDLAKAIGKEGGLKLKSREGWSAEDDSSGNGIDLFGFAGLPAGIFYEGDFLYQGLFAYFWTATESSADAAWFRSLSFDSDEIYSHSNYKQAAYSVRCVQDL